MNFEFEMEITLPIKVYVEGFIPERPAPACNNPDSPLYSDSGDDAEYRNAKISILVPDYIRRNGMTIKTAKEFELPSFVIDKIFDACNEEIHSQICYEGEREFIEKQNERRYEDELDRELKEQTF